MPGTLRVAIVRSYTGTINIMGRPRCGGALHSPSHVDTLSMICVPRPLRKGDDGPNMGRATTYNDERQCRAPVRTVGLCRAGEDAAHDETEQHRNDKEEANDDNGKTNTTRRTTTHSETTTKTKWT